jgi:hypothetical protein
MFRFLSASVVLLVALGCGRQEAVGPKETTRVPEPNVIIGDPPVPDDGTIPPPRPVPVRSAEEALRAGVEYLVKQQSLDGAWRSDVYATFKDGTALTPLVLCALQEAAGATWSTHTSKIARFKASVWLAKFVKDDGTIEPPPDGFEYSVYTAALCVKALSHPENADRAKARAAWVKYLKERQLTEKLGWKSEDKQYGGWGYCRVIPKKPEPEPKGFAPTLLESNLSATVFALDALKSAGETDAAMYKAAAIFVRRCQNWLEIPIPVYLASADGGFFFIYDDPVRNKAGKADSEVGIFNSYGSTSADGLRALALCNDPADDERREAARKWLLENFSATKHPGRYVKAHEPNRNAVYYYYAASAAQAFRTNNLKLHGRDWAAELSQELALRQAKDGSWTNPVEQVRENEPLVATSNAVLALARCREK